MNEKTNKKNQVSMLCALRAYKLDDKKIGRTLATVGALPVLKNGGKHERKDEKVVDCDERCSRVEWLNRVLWSTGNPRSHTRVGTLSKWSIVHGKNEE